MEIDLKTLTIQKAHQHLKDGDFKVSDLVSAYLEKIQNQNQKLNAFLEIYPNLEEQIKKAELMFKEKKATLMTGIPIALKDNILSAGHFCSAGSKILSNYKATYDSYVVQKLKDQGAILLGRTNMDEFAMGSSTETSAYGLTKNPYDLNRVPGGSSGGSAVAVASEMALVSLGTETCGSVRQPASFCNLVGLKPTYGAVSRSGIIAMGSSLDQVGPMAKNVEDVQALFNSIVGHDTKDSTSLPESLRKKEVRTLKKRLAVPSQFLKGEGIDQEVLINFEESCLKLKKAGYDLVDVDLSFIKYSLAVYYIIMPAEVSSNLARYDCIRYGFSEKIENLLEVYKKSRGQNFGQEVRRRILLGTYILSHGYYDAYYNTAIKVRKLIKNELDNLLKDFDAFITPTVPFLPFKLGEKLNDPLAMYLCDIFSAPANLADLPAITVPAGLTKDNLPLGIQFTGSYLGEEILFSLGQDFEKIR